ncbi:hypothetical protein PR048_014993 [Dryococelus australis]|uniref:Uncharacterized protein n=1 Tax=Dryococelus australis TaxID=614101 RepID=A0ABQ9HFR0_9NEOP|nr:hypothetical protein PR048_014993 [Dryococelus australis]
MYVCGLGYSLFKSFSETLGLCLVSHSAYYRILKKYVTPTIRMTDHILRLVVLLIQTCGWLAIDNLIALGSAQIIYVNSGKIVDFVILQKGQVDGELGKIPPAKHC